MQQSSESQTLIATTAISSQDKLRMNQSNYGSVASRDTVNFTRKDIKTPSTAYRPKWGIGANMDALPAINTSQDNPSQLDI